VHCLKPSGRLYESVHSCHAFRKCVYVASLPASPVTTLAAIAGVSAAAAAASATFCAVRYLNPRVGRCWLHRYGGSPPKAPMRICSHAIRVEEKSVRWIRLPMANANGFDRLERRVGQQRSPDNLKASRVHAARFAVQDRAVLALQHRK